MQKANIGLCYRKRLFDDALKVTHKFKIVKSVILYKLCDIGGYKWSR